MEYPQSWGALSQPHRRLELIEFLKELADPACQKKDWLHPNPSDGDGGIDAVIHFFFDDTSLNDDINTEIGTFLKSKLEAEAISEVVNRLGEILSRLGDADSEAYILDIRWAGVVSAASAALKAVV